MQLLNGLRSDKKWSPNLCLLRYLSQFRKEVAGRINAQFQKETAGRIWPAGRRLPTPDLSHYSPSNRVPNLPMVKPFSVYRSPSSLETLPKVVSRAQDFRVGSSSAWIWKKCRALIVSDAGSKLRFLASDRVFAIAGLLQQCAWVKLICFFIKLFSKFKATSSISGLNRAETGCWITIRVWVWKVEFGWGRAQQLRPVDNADSTPANYTFVI